LCDNNNPLYYGQNITFNLTTICHAGQRLWI